MTQPAMRLQYNAKIFAWIASPNTSASTPNSKTRTSMYNRGDTMGLCDVSNARTIPFKAFTGGMSQQVKRKLRNATRDVGTVTTTYTGIEVISVSVFHRLGRKGQGRCTVCVV